VRALKIMPMHPQVSVVINSYNHAAFVGEAIQSVLDQSFQDFEIVVTDDASTDGTPDIVKGFADPRISLEVFERNRGTAVALNATIARARGEFIAILNSDDFALPGRLATQVAFLRANPHIAAVFGLPRAVDERGAPAKCFVDFMRPFSLTDLSQKSWLNFFFFHGNCLCDPTAMIRRSAYQEVGSYDPRLINLEDFDMWVRICSRHDIHVMREELTAYRVRNDNRNMSAPRPDTLLRSQFEFSQILRRYRTMSTELLRNVFADQLVASGISSDGPHDLWLAELALLAGSPAHRLFALETFFETAQQDSQLQRLRSLTGSIDLFGLMAANNRTGAAERSRSWLYSAPLRWIRRLRVNRPAHL
jgi:glycosyltransferase involved in cell wall biosynthesis